MTQNIWASGVDVAASGKTAGTYDTIGTVTIKGDAKYILGIAVLVANSGPTSGENGVPLLKVTSTDLGIAGETFPLAGVITDGIATNDKEMPVLAEWIPFREPESKAGNVGGSKVTFSISSNVAVTEGWDIAVSLVYSDQRADQQLYMEIAAGTCAPCSIANHTESDGGISAATYTAFTTGLDVSGAAKELVGIGGFVNPNTPTAKEACVGVVKFESGMISNFSPQEWPFNVGWSASLGTPVGSQGNVQTRNGLVWPTRFKLPEKSFTMDISMILATALTNAGDGVAYYRAR